MAIPNIYIATIYTYGLTIRNNYMRKLRNDYSPTTHELRKYYGRITDGNNGVLHYFYNYVYGVIRYATLTFDWPLL